MARKLAGRREIGNLTTGECCLLLGRDLMQRLRVVYLLFWACVGLAVQDACGPIPGQSYASCSSIATAQSRCSRLSPAALASMQNECDRQYALGLQGCPQAIDALAQCLPTASCEQLRALSSNCTQLAGDVATRCGPSVAAQNSNTAQSRGLTSYR